LTSTQYQTWSLEDNPLPKLSIIIPTFNESKNLPSLLSNLLEMGNESEIIIVDCDSQDKTKEISSLYGAKVYNSPLKNRGFQLNYGSKKAKGEWFCFIHADSRLKKGWSKEIKQVMKKNYRYIYFFRFRVNSKKVFYKLLEYVVNVRGFLFKTPYGDQGLLISRENYIKTGGYQPLPIMEDIDFIKRIKEKKVKLKPLENPMYTNSRKWERVNFIFQAFKNWRLRQRWSQGESLEKIYEEYYKVR